MPFGLRQGRETEHAAGCLNLKNRHCRSALAAQGYMEAAQAFSRESGTSPGPCDESVVPRAEIRLAIQAGDIQRAVELLNDLHPDVLSLIHI